MANYESAAIYTDNERLFEVLERYFEKEENHSLFYEVEEGRIVLRNRQGATIDSLLHLSILDADTVITAEMSFESSRYTQTKTYEIQNGSYELIDVEEKGITFQVFKEKKDYDVDEINDIELDSPFTITDEEEEFYEEMNEIFVFKE